MGTIYNAGYACLIDKLRKRAGIICCDAGAWCANDIFMKSAILPNHTYWACEGDYTACVAKRPWWYIIDFYGNQGKPRWKTLPEGITKKKAKGSIREIENQLQMLAY